MFFVIITLIIVLWLFFSKISFEIKNIKSETKVTLSFLSFIKIKMDYKKFIKKFGFIKGTKDLNKRTINNYIDNVFVSRKLYNDLCKRVCIDKFGLYKVVNIKDRSLDMFSNTLFLISSSYIKTYLKTNFKELKKDEYLIVRDDNNKNEYDFHFKMNIRVFRLLYVLIKNVKLIYKVLKIKRSNHGTSDTHAT